MRYRALLLVLPLVLPVRQAAAGEDNLPLVPATATWGELRAAPAYALPGGGSVRIGVESASAEADGGVLVYALTVDWDGSAWEGRAIPGGALGPLMLRPGGGTIQALVEESAADPPPAEALYLVLLAAGAPQATIHSSDGTPLAAVRVETVPAQGPSWTVLRPGGSVAALAPDDGGSAAHAFLRPAPTGRALPARDGLRPVADGAAHADGDPLPRADPRLDERARLSVVAVGADGVRLSLEADEPFIVARADWHLLARWWVGGRPVVPPPLKQFQDMNGIMSLGQRLSIDLALPPGLYGAQPGDEVELQLLWCLDGWTFVDRLGMEQLHHRFSTHLPDFLLSNRVRFPMPGATPPPD